MNRSLSNGDERDRAMLSRRGLFGLGGAVSLAAVVAACGDGGGSDQPGRVGNAPPATPLDPADPIDDVLLLRTAASIEYTIIGLYGSIRELDAFPGELSAPLDEFVRRHQDNADRVNELVTGEGGTPWTCGNPWLEDRFTQPILELIAEGSGEARPPSDDPERDAFATMFAFENLAGASYQQLVAELSRGELRQAVAELSAGSVRRAAFLAYTGHGAPDGYIHPEISGAPPEEEEDDAEGDDAETVGPLYAMASPFGQLASQTLTVGAPDTDGARESFMIETPAENSYIFADTECPS